MHRYGDHFEHPSGQVRFREQGPPELQRRAGTLRAAHGASGLCPGVAWDSGRPRGGVAGLWRQPVGEHGWAGWVGHGADSVVAFLVPRGDADVLPEVLVSGGDYELLQDPAWLVTVLPCSPGTCPGRRRLNRASCSAASSSSSRSGSARYPTLTMTGPPGRLPAARFGAGQSPAGGSSPGGIAGTGGAARRAGRAPALPWRSAALAPALCAARRRRRRRCRRRCHPGRRSGRTTCRGR